MQDVVVTWLDGRVETVTRSIGDVVRGRQITDELGLSDDNIARAMGGVAAALCRHEGGVLTVEQFWEYLDRSADLELVGESEPPGEPSATP